MISNHENFSGPDIAYIYNQADFAIYGTFDENANLIKGKKVKITKKLCDELGLMSFQYSDPVEPSGMFINYSFELIRF